MPKTTTFLVGTQETVYTVGLWIMYGYVWYVYIVSISAMVSKLYNSTTCVN